MSLYLRYHSPAEDSDEGWENSSIPLGCGYMGACVFGIPERDRIQITENSLVNPGLDDWMGPHLGGLNHCAEIYIECDHQNVSNYERRLCLDRAVAETSYALDGVEYKREYFTSYPDKVLVTRLTASKDGALNFRLIPTIPFIKPYARKEGDGGGKSGEGHYRGGTGVDHCHRCRWLGGTSGNCFGCHVFRRFHVCQRRG